MRNYLLDKNAVSEIKDSVAGKKIPIDRLSKLRSIDINNNFISPLLSIIEGQSGIKESREQIKVTLKKESLALSSFFKNARTDAQYLSDNIDLFLDAFSGNIEEKFDDYLDLVKLSHELLAIPSKDKDLIQKQFLDFAKIRGIAFGHPSLICCLATLYGNSDARKVLKPKLNGTEDEKDKRAYNAASDLLVLSRIQTIRALQSPMEKKRIKIKFLTFDIGLEGFLKSISIIESKRIDDTTTRSEVSYARTLFPGLSDEEYFKLIDKLTGVSQ